VADLGIVILALLSDDVERTAVRITGDLRADGHDVSLPRVCGAIKQLERDRRVTVHYVGLSIERTLRAKSVYRLVVRG
jgi:hypothetical protein